MVDKFVLMVRQRLISGKVRNQEHSRRYESYFLVFKKDVRRKVRYFAFCDGNAVDGILIGLKEHNIKR